MTYRVDARVFDATSADWSTYQSTNAGRLRNELLWQGLAGHLPSSPGRVLDLGAGTGELAARCHAEGHHVTLVDFSQAMLAEASRHLSGSRVQMICATFDEASGRLERGSFDVVACHSVLEFVQEPGQVIKFCAEWLTGRGVLSVAFGNSGHAPIRSAIVERDFDRAGREIEGPSEAVDCFGLPKHLLDPGEIRTLLVSHGLRPVVEHGIRVVADLLDPALAADPERFAALLALERQLMRMPAYAGVARYLQIVARGAAY